MKPSGLECLLGLQISDSGLIVVLFFVILTIWRGAKKTFVVVKESWRRRATMELSLS
jgi:hypothetical protein